MEAKSKKTEPFIPYNPEYAGKVIKSSDLYVPFYDHAVMQRVREEIDFATFIDIYLKGGRFSGKTYFFIDLVLELSYKDPARSTIVVANSLVDHLERGVRFFDKVLASLGLTHEWKWHTKKTRPVLVRNVNGYTQEIRFLSLADLENAGFEPPVNVSTGKVGYYGILWADEVAKKDDSRSDADFTYIEKLKDAFVTAKNTFVRHFSKDHPYGKQNLLTLWSLNPWGGENPIVQEFHKYMSDDVDKLVKDGYNISYYKNKNSFRIYGTTNYKVNTKLNEEALDAIEDMRKEERALTMMYGVTGRTSNSVFGRQLDLMSSMNKAGNVPSDEDFMPINLSMDVGNVTALYLNGFDARYLVKDFEDYYPTRIITKGEWYSDVKTDMRNLKERYIGLLKHIKRLANRFPEMRRDGIILYIDASARETVELLKAYMVELSTQDKSFDLQDWLQVRTEDSKWNSKERRAKREDRFSEMIASGALIVDQNECPQYYKDLHRIVSNKTMDRFDHCWDAHMYGIMSIYRHVYRGLQIKAIQNKPDTLIEEA